MSRIAHLFLSLFVTVSLFGGAAFAEEDQSLAEVRAKMDAMFDEISPEHVDKSPISGWYKVQKGSIVAYVSRDGRYLMQGDLIDLDQQVNLTERSRVDARRTLLAEVGDEDVIMFSPAEKKYSVTIFTDVDCTYCRKMHREIEQYLAEGIEIRYMLYPRNGPASPSWGVSENVWCASNRNQALTDAKLDRDFESHRCDASMVTNHYIAGQDIGLTGTPAIVFDDGTLVSGYLPAAALLQRLDAIAGTPN